MLSANIKTGLETASCFILVTSGVLQGSVLRSMLFKVFVNNIPSA